jgi:NhaC family Na+:H+ antiporter
MFKSAFAKRGLAPVVLSRSIGDTGTPTGALIPWNSCGAFMAATLGVATLSYAPYAILNIVSPLITIAFAFLGIRMMRVAPAQAGTGGDAGAAKR